MRSFFEKDKLIAKIVSVFLACFLWIYVMGDQNPMIERSYVVDLQMSNLSAHKQVFNAPSTVNVRVRGPRAVLGELKASNIMAYLDLDKVKTGQNTESVRVIFDQGDVIEISPRTVEIFVDDVKTVAMPVVVDLKGALSDDYELGNHAPIPAEVNVKGAAHRIELIKSIQASIDISGRTTSFSTVAGLTPVGNDGVEVKDISLDPNEIHVEFVINPKIESKDIPVEMDTLGNVINGKVTATLISPEFVTVTGMPSVISKIEKIETESVDLIKIQNSTRVEAKLKLPEGVTSNTDTVSISLTVEKD